MRLDMFLLILYVIILCSRAILNVMRVDTYDNPMRNDINCRLGLVK